MAHSASPSDVANQAVRMFLQRCGARYDEKRGLSKFTSTKPQQGEVLEFFKHKCCYCGTPLGKGAQEAHFDHLVAINKEAAGLHAWGNVVCACGACNRRKSNTSWKDFLVTGNGLGNKKDVARRRKEIVRFTRHYGYRPKLHEFQAAAQDLYREVAGVAKTLVEIKIDRSLDEDDTVRREQK